MGCCESVTQEEQDARAAAAGGDAPLLTGILTQQCGPRRAVRESGSLLISTMHREGSTANGRVFEYRTATPNAQGVELIAGIDSAQGVPGLALMPDGSLLVSTFTFATRRASILRFTSTNPGQSPADAQLFMSDIVCHNGPPDLAVRPDTTLLVATQSEYGPPRGSVYSFAPGVQVWSQGVLLIDGKRGNAPGNFPSKLPQQCWDLGCILPRAPAIPLRTGPGGAPSMALRPDGAILLAKKEHPGSVGSVYEFGSGARSGNGTFPFRAAAMGRTA